MACLNKPHNRKFLKAVLNLTWSILEYIVWYIVERFEKIVNEKQFSTKKISFIEVWQATRFWLCRISRRVTLNVASIVISN